MIMKNLILYLCIMFVSGSLHAQETYKGLYVSAFERSDFMPCNSNEHWWLQGSVYSMIEEFIKDNSLRSGDGDWNPNSPVYIEVVGSKSNKGMWGHMGAYQYKLNAMELVEVSATNKCSNSNGLTRQFNMDSFPRRSRSLSFTLLQATS